MKKDIVIDEYLKKLSADIIKDKDIKFLSFDNSDNKTNYDEIKNQIQFFNNVNIKLHKVKILEDDIERYLDPKYIDLELNDKLGSKVNSVFDSVTNELCYLYMTIGNVNNYYPKIAYIYEIVRTQVNEHYNVNDEFNKLLIPMFMELIYSDSINYDNRVNDRLYELGLSILFLDEVNSEENKIYIKSLLQALNLYRLYNKSGNSFKKEMMYYMNLLFNRDIYVEDLLNIYEVNYDNSKKDLKVLKRSK